MKKGIIIAHNNGLGDLIVMNGCVRYLASQYDVAYLLCFDSRMKHYEFMYRDSPNIILFNSPHPQNSRQARMRQDSESRAIQEQHPDIDWSAGLRRTYWTKAKEWVRYAKRLKPSTKENIWPELFYAIMKVPHEERYKSYHVLRDNIAEQTLQSKVKPPEKYAFVIDKTRMFEYELEIKSGLPVINPFSFDFWPNTLIFDWIKIIENATEIHTVDTSWFHLIRMLQLKIPKFYYEVRNLIMIGDGYLNDSFDSGWTRIVAKGN
ncbi:MAG: hypothetical protein ABF261_07720 [Candidatus Arcticimaribacter sp.]